MITFNRQKPPKEGGGIQILLLIVCPLCEEEGKRKPAVCEGLKLGQFRPCLGQMWKRKFFAGLATPHLDPRFLDNRDGVLVIQPQCGWLSRHSEYNF